MKRNPRIDFIKGVAIITVVIGHCWTIDKSLFNFIYSFHMPLFFCISGYLFSNRAPFKEFVISKAKAILIPYAFYFTCSYLCTVMILKTPRTVPQFLIGMLLGGNYCSKFFNTPLWYLPLFFISLIAFYWLLKIDRPIIKYAVIISGALISIPFNKLLFALFPDKLTPFNIQALLPSLFFMFVGYELKRVDMAKIKARLTPYAFYAVILLMFGAGMLLSKNNTDQIISLFMTYEFYIYPLLIMPLIMTVCYNTRNRQIEIIGANSITILGFHRLILHIFSDTFGFEEHFVITGANNFVLTMVFSVFCIFIICAGKVAYTRVKKLAKIQLRNLLKPNT